MTNDCFYDHPRLRGRRHDKVAGLTLDERRGPQPPSYFECEPGFAHIRFARQDVLRALDARRVWINDVADERVRSALRTFERAVWHITPDVAEALLPALDAWAEEDRRRWYATVYADYQSRHIEHPYATTMEPLDETAPVYLGSPAGRAAWHIRQADICGREPYDPATPHILDCPVRWP